MKSLPSIFLLIAIAAACPAHADLVVQKRLENIREGAAKKTFFTDITIKIRGDMARVDFSGGFLGNRSSISNFGTGEMLNILHGSKTAMLAPLIPSAIKAARDAEMKEIPKPKPTGQREKVGEFDAEIFETSISGKVVKLWVAKNLPKAEAIREQLDRVIYNKNDPADTCMFDVPGVVVKTERSGLGKLTVTLVSIKEESVPESEFKVPEGYKTTKALPAPGGVRRPPPTAKPDPKGEAPTPATVPAAK